MEPRHDCNRREHHAHASASALAGSLLRFSAEATDSGGALATADEIIAVVGDRALQGWG